MLLIKRFVFVIITCAFCFVANAQRETSQYEATYIDIVGMLAGQQSLDFKKAVFLVEDAYLGGVLDYKTYDYTLQYYKSLCEKLIQTRDLEYDGIDINKVSKFAAVYTVMKDTIPVIQPDGEMLYHMPFEYDFEDISGESDWRKMFVTKLLSTHKGNCHSLPYLYKIITEELGEEAHLAFAPNHIYIKQRCKSMGWYNTELTSGMFPVDAWLMASGYVHLKSIQNGVYMDALNDKQSIAVCLVDLAQGYQKKFGKDDGTFVLKACDKALKYYPNYINAMLLQVETMFHLWETNVEGDNESKAKGLADIQTIYDRIHELGYRKMPEEMYLDWLVSLKNEGEKYNNKKIKF